MDYRKANRVFLYAVISTLALTVLYTLWVSMVPGDLNIILNNALSELVVLVPALAVVLFHGERLGNVIIFKKIKLKSVLLTFLYVMLLYPLVTFVNSVSMLFVDNTVLEVSDQILSLPVWQIVLSFGILGPFIEEIVFRGVILQSYQRTGRILASILLSSFLFGLIHMNFNQFAYGAVMGVMFALLFEATGSVLASFIAHAIFNTTEALLMFASSDAISEAQQYLDSMEFGDTTLISIGIYFVLAIIGTSLAMCVVYKMSEIEGRKEFMASILKGRKKGTRLITFPLILAIVLAIAYMILLEVLLSI